MKAHRIPTAGISVALLLTAGMGCRSEREQEVPTTTMAPKPMEGTPSRVAEPPPTAEPAAPGEAAGTGQQQATDPGLAIITVTRVDVDPRLTSLCGLERNDVFFNYDSASLQPEAKERLDRIAQCATTGAAKGMELRVVGRTDPVGTDAANKQLGMNRAESVAQYLQQQGIKQARTETLSRGEQGAEAIDPLGWPRDRRVTIRLADDAQPGQPAPR
ncbi:MAG: OmpA family protein [Myxococcota bacterium]|nr:OmpA family protein [Myxococcota bacterium]